MKMSVTTPQPRAAGRRYRSARRCGFTLLELVIVITIIVIVLGIFLQRIPFYQEQAEKAAMDGVVGSIQSALVLQYGQIMTRGKASDMDFLVRDNPMNWLQKKPRNYAGEYFDPTPQSIPPGNWMFDLKSRDLIYVPRHTEHFKPGADGRNWIRFHVVLLYERPRLPSLRQGPSALTGVLFEPLAPYAWF